MQTRDIQGELWSSAPADWAKYVEPTFIPMYQAVLRQLRLDEEKMLLDAGCGSGLFLSMASSTGASVHGIDAAPGLLAISKERLPDATLMVEDLESIPFSSETFDVVTAFNSFQYAGSFENALREAARITKKHGKLVLGIWEKEDECESASISKAVARLLPPPPPGTADPFAISDDGRVEAICKTLGLTVTYQQTVFCPWQFNGIEELQQAFLCTAPCVKAMQIAGEPKVRKAITQSAQPFNLVDDVYFLRNYLTFFVIEKAQPHF